MAANEDPKLTNKQNNKTIKHNIPPTEHWPYLIVHQELGSFEVARGDSDVVLLSWVVKLGQTPVDKAQLRTEKFIS